MHRRESSVAEKPTRSVVQPRRTTENCKRRRVPFLTQFEDFRDQEHVVVHGQPNHDWCSNDDDQPATQTLLITPPGRTRGTSHKSSPVNAIAAECKSGRPEHNDHGDCHGEQQS